MLFRIFFQCSGESAAEACEMCAPLYGIDVVYKRMYILVVCTVVSQSNFHRYPLTLGVKMYHVIYKRFFVGVDVFNKFTKTVLGIESLATRIPLRIKITLVCKSQCDTGIKECEISQTYSKSVIVIFSNGEYGVIRPECNGGTCSITIPYHLEFGSRFAA